MLTPDEICRIMEQYVSLIPQDPIATRIHVSPWLWDRMLESMPRTEYRFPSLTGMLSIPVVVDRNLDPDDWYAIDQYGNRMERASNGELLRDTSVEQRMHAPAGREESDGSVARAEDETEGPREA